MCNFLIDKKDMLGGGIKIDTGSKIKNVTLRKII